jgi:hypothetical protein
VVFKIKFVLQNRQLSLAANRYLQGALTEKPFTFVLIFDQKRQRFVKLKEVFFQHFTATHKHHI